MVSGRWGCESSPAHREEGYKHREEKIRHCGAQLDTAGRCLGPWCPGNHRYGDAWRPVAPTYLPRRTPHCCPVCNGTGKVPRSGDFSTGSTHVECHACGGSGIVWDDGAPFPQSESDEEAAQCAEPDSDEPARTADDIMRMIAHLERELEEAQ